MSQWCRPDLPDSSNRRDLPANAPGGDPAGPGPDSTSVLASDAGEPVLSVRAERHLHSGRRFDYVELDVQPPAGGVIHHQGVRHRGAAVICPVLATDAGTRVLLIQNDRPITGRRLWEIPAGLRDLLPDGTVEDPAITAAREVVEETGYRAGQIEHLVSLYPTPGITDELMHVYAALHLEHVGQALEHGETISVHPTEPREAMKMIDDGRIIDGKTIAGLLLAERRGLLGG